MRLLWIPVFLAAAAVSSSSAQTPITATSAATVGTPAKPAKPAAKAPDKPKAEPPKPKYLVKVHLLKATEVSLSGCYTSPLVFPASNADQVAKALASEPDYTFVALPPDQVAIYYKERTATPPRNLAAIEGDMDKLAVADFQYAEAITVPHGSATKTLKQLNLPPDGPLTAAAVDDRCIMLVSKTATPDPVTMAALRRSLPQIYWRTETTQSTQRLFHLDASAVVKKLSGASDSAADKSSGDSSSPVSASSKSSGNSASAKPSTTSPSKPGAAPGNTLAQNIAVSVAAGGSTADTSGSDNPDASDATGDSGSAKGPAAKTRPGKAQPDKTKKDVPAPPKPIAMQPVNDTLVYSNDDGSDKGFFERNRLMAVLDLPRPEILMNIWSLQVSTRDPKIASLEAESAGELVSHNNESLENSIEQGWQFLSQRMAGNARFFEPKFYSYVTQKFAETQSYVDAADLYLPADAVAIDTADRNIGEATRKRWGWCPPYQYCLGFIHAFEPIRPTLTNILLTIMAASQSKDIADETIEAMQCAGTFDAASRACTPPRNSTPPCAKHPESPDSCVDTTALGRFGKCVDKARTLLNTLRLQSAVGDCELDDRISLLDQISLQEQGKAGSQQGNALRLSCFKEQADQSFGSSSGTNVYAVTRVGLLRAAVADFLFNYKWATQYPHDFIPYDLTQSAQELNAEFNPLVLAFNRDVKAFTQNLETELQCKHDAYHPSALDPLAWFRKGDETFLNDGMISVRGISGVESIVDTVTQSFFDATKPPSLTDLVKSVSDAENNVPGVLKTNLSANEAAVLLGALNSVQPAQAKIGRELKLDIIPHALAGASSAELEVKLTADESANPTLFKADKRTEDTLSRVAKHDTNTRVRVESIKLFDVSAFSAMLQRPRSKFPIVPPFFEVPYFGSFIGWPLPGAKVYHRSTAIVSAIIVPTAADLAFGIEFSADRVCDATHNPNQPLHCEHAHSPYDFGSLSLRNFHKAIVQCFASDGITPYAGKLWGGSEEMAGVEPKAVSGGIVPDNLCDNLSLVRPDLTQPKAGVPLGEKRKTDGTVPPN
jgi:hypothetical protein